MRNSIVIIFLSLFAASCSSDGGLEPSDSFTLTIQNSFTTNLSIEIWRGDNLSYDNGTVYGDSLAKLKEVTTLNASASTSLGAMKNEQYDVLLIFGDATANNYYWNEYELDSPSGVVSLTISSTGLITRN